MYRELQRGLETVVVTTVTPFDAGGGLDEEAVVRQVEWLVAAGVACLVPGGNTGEFSSLGVDELERMVELTVEAASGRALVVAGVGWSSPIAADMARRAEQAGASGVMVHHPVHTYLDPAGLAGYYQRICEAVDIGVILYKRGPQLGDELIGELVGEEQVVGVKYAVNDPNAFGRLVDLHPTEAAWVCGTAERWAPFFFLAGAGGFTSGLANFAPERSLEMLAALRAGDFGEAMRIRRVLAPFEELRAARPHNADNVPAVKEAMERLGLCRADVRDPLVRLSGPDRELVHRLLDEWGIAAPAASTGVS